MDLYLEDKEQVVVNEPKDSETPSILVVESSDQEHPGELSPNPHGFGFSKQKIVDSLPAEGEFNVLYLVKIKSAESGDKVLGYRYFKWNTATREYELVNPTQPQIKDVKSPVSSPIASEEEEKPSFAKIINGNVGIVNGELYINGKKVVIDPNDDQGFKILTLSSESGTLTDEQYQLALSDECAILVAPVYLYKDRNASTLLLYKSSPFVSNDKTYYLEVEITKADKSYLLRQVELPSGAELDVNVTVEIESDYTNDDFQNRTTYADPISLKEFIDNCESGTYTNAGTIAKINNLIDGHAFRLILIGIESDVLAYDDTTKAKTTWQFLDQPEHQCRLGLPFNVIDWGSTSGRAAANAYLDGTNESALTWYPSNKGGYITAVGLLNVLHTIYEGLPIQLKRAIKTIRKAFNIPRQTRSIAANGGAESDSSGTGYIAQKLFHLSATENNNTGYGTEGTAYTYLNSNARRIRYYNNTTSTYWLRTPSPSLSSHWVYVGIVGDVGSYSTDYGFGVAPAFCI